MNLSTYGMFQTGDFVIYVNYVYCQTFQVCCCPSLPTCLKLLLLLNPEWAYIKKKKKSIKSRKNLNWVVCQKVLASIHRLRPKYFGIWVVQALSQPLVEQRLA